MIKKDIVKCSKCGREARIPVYATQAKIEAQMERVKIKLFVIVVLLVMSRR